MKRTIKIIIASILIVCAALLVRLHPDHPVDSFFSWFLFLEYAIFNYYEFKDDSSDRWYILGVSSVVVFGWLLYFHFSVLGLSL